MSVFPFNVFFPKRDGKSLGDICDEYSKLCESYQKNLDEQKKLCNAWKNRCNKLSLERAALMDYAALVLSHLSKTMQKETDEGQREANRKLLSELVEQGNNIGRKDSFPKKE